jgi:hypothetical protein
MSNRQRMNRDVFLNALVCPRLGWLIRKGNFKREDTLAQQVNLEQEKRIKERIRNQFTNGVLVSEKDFNAARKKTLLLLNNKDVGTIFDAAFTAGGYDGSADIITREDGLWRLHEIKSATQVKQKYLDDIAYTLMITEAAGLRVSSASIILISKKYRLGMADKQLFKCADCTKEARSIARAFKVFMEPIDSLTSGLNQPKVNLIYECKNCTLFSQCIGTEHEGHIFELPRLTEPKFKHLTRIQVRYMFDIPTEFPLAERQKIALRCMETGKPYIGRHLREKLSTISLPGDYLDFEPVMTPIPLYESVAPFERIPVSFFIHKSKKAGMVTDHLGYIADPHRDCRQEFAERLLNDLDAKGSIIVYGNREKEMLDSMKKAFPQYAGPLTAVANRFVDLQSIIAKEFYHPGFRGSTSMERVAPVLSHKVFSSRTEIHTEDDAIAAFASMALGKLREDEMIEVLATLSDYNKMKTISIAQIHEGLLDYVH